MPVKDQILTKRPKSAGKSKKALPTIRTRKSALKQKDLLSKYLKEIRRYEILSPEAEKKIALRHVEEGDRDAAHALITANLRLVVKIAFQYHRQWANVLDLIQEGNIGLVEALERYDPYRGIRFSSYAQYWIRAMVLRFLMDNFNTEMVIYGARLALKNYGLPFDHKKLKNFGKFFERFGKLIIDA